MKNQPNNNKDKEHELQCSGFGKHFASMYDGSMVGSGPVVFAVMGYVIAKQIPQAGVFYVELNPELLRFIIGCSDKEVEKAITFLCSPDKKSRSNAESGRRLVREGQFLYRVVNGMKYRLMGSIQRRREQWREAKRKQRDSVPRPNQTVAERHREAALQGGDDYTVQRIDKITSGEKPDLSDELGGPNT